MRGPSASRSAGNQPPVVANVCRGPLRASFRAAPGLARVHLAVPKSVGTAVTRNRVRRRVRETLRVLAREEALVLVGGEFRLSVAAPLEHLSSTELRTMMGALLRALQHR